MNVSGFPEELIAERDRYKGALADIMALDTLDAMNSPDARYRRAFWRATTDIARNALSTKENT